MRGISINYPTQARAALPWLITASGIHRANNEHIQRHDWRPFLLFSPSFRAGTLAKYLLVLAQYDTCASIQQQASENTAVVTQLSN